MLYNVLPPLIFFTSLGGIIVVVSRVLLRIRANNHLQDIRQQSARVSVTRSQKTEQLEELIGPNQKSVQSVKTRLALVKRSVRRLAAAPGHTVQHIRQRREQKASQVSVQPSQPHPPAEAGTASAIILPPAPPARRRLAASLQSLTAAAGQRTASLREAARRRRRERQARRDSQAVPPQSSAPVLPADAPAAKPTISLSMLNKPVKQAAPSRQQEHIARRPARSARHGRTPSVPAGQPASALERAKQALIQKEYGAAERILVPHLAGHPRDTACYMLLGKTAAAQGHWDEAAEIYEQVIKIDPAHAGSRAALGRARYELGQFTKAIEALRRAHDEEPENIAVIEYLLKIARRMDNVPMQRSLTQELAELEHNI